MSQWYKHTLFSIALSLLFVPYQFSFAVEWTDNFDDKSFTEKWWEPIPQKGEVGVDIWKKGWYSVKSIGDGNVAFSLLKLKVGGDFVKTFDSMVMKGMFMDSGTGPGRSTAFMAFSYTEKEAYIGGGFIGGRQALHCLGRIENRLLTEADSSCPGDLIVAQGFDKLNPADSILATGMRTKLETWATCRLPPNYDQLSINSTIRT